MDMTNILEEIDHLINNVNSGLEDDTIRISNDNAGFNINFGCEVFFESLTSLLGIGSIFNYLIHIT